VVVAEALAILSMHGKPTIPQPNVRFGSQADLIPQGLDVRSSLNNGHL